MVSAVFRRGGDVSFVVEELKAVFDPRGGQWMAGRYVPSLLAAIGEVIERHMQETAEEVPTAVPPAPEPDTGPAVRIHQCPRCGQPGLLRQEGCDLCSNCGYSKCG
jgi:ribonucleoside-diphosphate reductase alpha chain